MAVTDALGHEPAEHAGGRSGEGVDPDETALLRGGGGAGVEAEPAEPEDRRTEHDERDVVRAVVRVLAEAAAVADDQDEDEARDTGVDVHHGAAGEVDCRAERLADGAVGAEETAAPHHERDRAVDQGHPDRHEKRPGAELRTVGDGAGDQSHRDDGEGGGVAGLDQAVRGADVLQTEGREGVAEQFENAFAAAHGGSPEDPHHADDADGDEAHHHHVQGGFGTGHAAVEECQAGRHEQHQGRSHHDPHIAGGKFHGFRSFLEGALSRGARGSL
ncbi:hypothetical protein QFZ52_001825 [Arthrobacter woluwensis]|nr:hypothetical protein [Arthrobacter woluwensis]